MRKLNLKRVSILFLGVLATCAVVGLVHYLQEGRIAQALLWQARRAEEQGRPEQVVKYLGRYLDFAPQDNDERTHLGLTLADPKIAVSPRAKTRALFVLEQVLTKEPERNDARLVLARLALELERYEQAQENLEALHEANPDDGEVDHLLGQVQEARQQRTEAIAWYRRAVQHAPQKIDSAVRLAHLLRRLNTDKKGTSEAEQVLKQMVEGNRQNHQAFLARWNYRKQYLTTRDKDQIKDAAKDLDAALALAPEEVEVLLAVAEAEESLGQIEQSRAHLQAGLRLHADDVRLYQGLAWLEAQAGRAKEAAAALRQGLEAVPPAQHSELLWRLANLLLDNDEATEADTVLEQIRQRNLGPALQDYLTARAHMLRQRWAEAAKLLERARPLLEAMPDMIQRTDLLLGRCYDQLGDPTQQMAVYRRLVARDPTSVVGHLGLATAQATLGKTDAAIAQYRQLLKLPNAPAAGWTELARLLLLRYGQGVKELAPEIEEALRRADKARPNDVAVVLLRADWLLAGEQVQKAEELLRQASRQQPKEAAFRLALVRLVELRKDDQEAKRLLDETEADLGDSVEVRLARASQIVKTQPNAAADLLTQLGQAAEKFKETERVRLLHGLAEAAYRTNQVALAQTFWTRLAQRAQHHNDLRLRFLLFELALQTNDMPAAQQQQAEIQRIEGAQGSLGRFSEALRLIWLARQGDKSLLDEARVQLDAVAVQRPDWPAVLVARAEIDDLRDNPEQAIANYRRAIDLGERNPRSIRHFVSLLYKRQRFDEADRAIRAMQQQTTLSPELQRLAVDVSLHNQDPTRAVQIAEQTVAADARDYRDHLWLGQVLAASGQRTKEAEQALRRAVELADTVPETWTALVRFLASQRRPDEAAAAFAQAKAKLPAAQASLALAQCCEVLGRLDEARQHYQAALKNQPNEGPIARSVADFYLRSGNLHDAEPLLRRLVSRRLQVAEADVAWARRSLALVLTASGDYQRYPEALTLVGLSLDAAGKVTATADASATEDDQRMQAKVLAARNQREPRVRAIALLEGLAKRHAATPDDQFLLARLYEANEAWPKAREQLRDLLTAEARNPTYLASYTRSLLRHKELDEAERNLTRLEQLEKASASAWGSVELRAQLLAARDQGSRALDLLRANADKPDARPEALLSLVRYLGSHQHLDEALERCEQAWKTLPPEVLGATCVAMLRDAKADDKSCGRVEGWLQAALRKQPQSTALRLHLADLADLRGRFTQAEAFYREVLHQDERNIVALNNLAWLMSQREVKDADALNFINRGIQLLGPRAELLDTRAVVHLAMGRGDLAVADLQTATTDAPSAARYFHLARAHHATNNLEGATAAFAQAKQAGLQPQTLHPLDLVAYNKIREELEKK